MAFKTKEFNVTAEKIAEMMRRGTNFNVTPDKVVKVGKDPRMTVYAAQVDDVTIFCLARMDGRFIVKYTCW